ncbi:hypothetical protein DRB06_09010 [Actinomyces sp. Z5]|nr:hypothetical protein DRB06_09010 [Actinomyces sp. Z5]
MAAIVCGTRLGGAPLRPAGVRLRLGGPGRGGDRRPPRLPAGHARRRRRGPDGPGCARPRRRRNKGDGHG